MTHDISDDGIAFRNSSGRSRDELLRIIAYHEPHYQKLFRVLRLPGQADGELWERSTSGLYRLLREEEPSLQGKSYTEISAIHTALLAILMGRY